MMIQISHFRASLSSVTSQRIPFVWNSRNLGIDLEWIISLNVKATSMFEMYFCYNVQMFQNCGFYKLLEKFEVHLSICKPITERDVKTDVIRG